MQVSILTALNNAKTLASEHAAPVVLDPSLEAFRIRVVSECLKAGVDPEKIAKLSDVLSTATKSMPASSSDIRDYIPVILSREQKKAGDAALSKYSLLSATSHLVVVIYFKLGTSP